MTLKIAAFVAAAAFALALPALATPAPKGLQADTAVELVQNKKKGKAKAKPRSDTFVNTQGKRRKCFGLTRSGGIRNNC